MRNGIVALVGALVLGIALGAGCGSGGSKEFAQFVHTESGIRQLQFRGQDLFEGAGGYYVIGGCDDSDTEAGNVNSLGSDGRTLRSGSPSCPGAPFRIHVVYVSTNAVRVEVEIGPMPVDYATLSVPLDVRTRFVDSFATDVAPLFVGGCGQVERRGSSEGHFESVPTPCPPGEHAIGLAETRAPAGIAVLHGPGARIERKLLDGDVVNVRFFRNLRIDVENSELVFGPRPAGSVVRLVEEITVD
jgi:hypothetical protein